MGMENVLQAQRNAAHVESCSSNAPIGIFFGFKILPPLIAGFQITSLISRRGGSPWVRYFFEDFFQNIDFWAEDAQNIFLESLEVFLKIFQKFFSYHTFWKFSAQWRKCRWCKKSACPGAGNTPKSPMGQKIDFFKVRDIVTPIEPRKKKHQTNVSSALKTF